MSFDIEYLYSFWQDNVSASLQRRLQFRRLFKTHLFALYWSTKRIRCATWRYALQINCLVTCITLFRQVSLTSLFVLTLSVGSYILAHINTSKFVREKSTTLDLPCALLAMFSDPEMSHSRRNTKHSTLINGC